MGAGKMLMIVAHPDDEVIFGGGHLLTKQPWHVICVTNGYDARRAREFAEAMRFVGADFDMWKYRDSYSNDLDKTGLKRDLNQVIQTGSYSQIVTHNRRGEYGHPQHQAIADIVRDLVKERLFVFALGRRTLPPPLLSRKKELLRIYQSQQETISELALNDYIEREYFLRVK